MTISLTTLFGFTIHFQFPFRQALAMAIVTVDFGRIDRNEVDYARVSVR